MNTEVQEPKLLGAVDRLSIDSRLEEKIEVPFDADGKKGSIYVEYTHHKRGDEIFRGSFGVVDKRTLMVSTNDILGPNDVPGVHGRFVHDEYAHFDHRSYLGASDSSSNAVAEKIFKEQVQPLLQQLPSYMKKLMG